MEDEDDEEVEENEEDDVANKKLIKTSNRIARIIESENEDD
jgi:hypothetical protein